MTFDYEGCPAWNIHDTGQGVSFSIRLDDGSLKPIELSYSDAAIFAHQLMFFARQAERRSEEQEATR